MIWILLSYGFDIVIMVFCLMWHFRHKVPAQDPHQEELDLPTGCLVEFMVVYIMILTLWVVTRMITHDWRVW